MVYLVVVGPHPDPARTGLARDRTPGEVIPQVEFGEGPQPKGLPSKLVFLKGGVGRPGKGLQFVPQKGPRVPHPGGPPPVPAGPRVGQADPQVGGPARPDPTVTPPAPVVPPETFPGDPANLVGLPDGQVRVAQAVLPGGRGPPPRRGPVKGEVHHPGGKLAGAEPGNLVVPLFVFGVVKVVVGVAFEKVLLFHLEVVPVVTLEVPGRPPLQEGPLGVTGGPPGKSLPQ